MILHLSNVLAVGIQDANTDCDKNIGKGYRNGGENKISYNMKRNWVRYIEIKLYVYFQAEYNLQGI